MKKTTNTTLKPEIGWLMGGNPNAIEQQEAEGQKEFVASTQLPIKGNEYGGVKNVVAQYHKMGIQTLTPSKGDDLFIGVKLPKGWGKKSTDHSMWNNLVDDKGRVRATMFYKAAFYDRDAFINFTTRYSWKTDFSDEDSRSHIVVDNADGSTIFNTEKMSTEVNSDYFKKQDAQQNLCKAWLTDNYPDWQDINAYWD